MGLGVGNLHSDHWPMTMWSLYSYTQAMTKYLAAKTDALVSPAVQRQFQVSPHIHPGAQAALPGAGDP